MPHPQRESSAALPTGGSVRVVTRWGESVMHRPAHPVTAYDEELRVLAADMVATMYAAHGVGLAACQIGVDLAIFVYDCPDASGTDRAGVVCNPQLELLEGKDRRLEDGDEGCLSYPGAYVECARPDFARVRGQDLDGGDIVVEGDGLLARCLQHETDHTVGIVFGDRLSSRARKRLRKSGEAEAARFPDDWPVTPELEQGAD